MALQNFYNVCVDGGKLLDAHHVYKGLYLFEKPLGLVRAFLCGRYDIIRYVIFPFHDTQEVLDTFRDAIDRGELTTLNKMIGKYPYILCFLEGYHGMLWRACEHGHLNVVKWLLVVAPTIDVSHGDHMAFRTACNTGHLELAEWLWLHDSDISLLFCSEKEIIFCDICQFGQLRVAQWFLFVNPEINISARDELAFRCACQNNRVPVVHWLLTLNHKILDSPSKFYGDLNLGQMYISFSWRMRWVCMLRLLMSKKCGVIHTNAHLCEYTVNEITAWYKEDRAKMMWPMRKYAVWMQTGLSRSKSTPFYRIPEDVSRYIIQSFL